MAENVFYSSAEKRDVQREHVEEDIYKQIEEMDVIEREMKTSKCESCVNERRYESVAVFLCFVCEIYVCFNCMRKHRSHKGMEAGKKESDRQTQREESERIGEQNVIEKKKTRKLVREKIVTIMKKFGKSAKSETEKEREKSESERMKKQSEREGVFGKFVDELMNESEIERRKELKNSHVSVCDRVRVKHELDQRKDCWITGLCGLENRRWVVCDCNNRCIKIFKLGSHVLQRCIRFVESEPWDVTEILLKQNSTEPNLVSGSSSDISAADRADQDKQSLIALTLTEQRQIMFMDLSKKPAKTQNKIKTKGPCYSIQFYDDKVFTVCRERRGSPWSVYILSTDGNTLKDFDTGIYGYTPRLAVVSGRVYLTDWRNYKVKCRNVEGQVLPGITVEGSEPTGISVDTDNNVYVCATHKIDKLDADLTRCKSVLDQTTDYIERPEALCYYRDKLFISHVGPPLCNFVTVVRLL